MPSTRTPSQQDDPTSYPVEEPDAVCAAAVDLARQAAEDIAETGGVGEHLSVVSDGERTVTHSFRSLAKGYRGWYWAVTVARAPRLRTATVSEAVLLPGPDAVLPPAWVPWSDRIAPGDLGASDALPYRADDPYLEPGYAQTREQDEDQLAVWELGLGRVRVLSAQGRDAAATRWYLGDRGPTADEAVNAAAACSGCGFLLPMAGALRQVFGVCGNEWSPSDGRVVSVDHGCGAHSETDIERIEPMPLPEPILDEVGHETVLIDRRPTGGQDVAAEIVDDDQADVAVDVADVEPADVADVEPADVAVDVADVGPEVADVEPADVAVDGAGVAPEVADVEPADVAFEMVGVDVADVAAEVADVEPADVAVDVADVAPETVDVQPAEVVADGEVADGEVAGVAGDGEPADEVADADAEVDPDRAREVIRLAAETRAEAGFDSSPDPAGAAETDIVWDR